MTNRRLRNKNRQLGRRRSVAPHGARASADLEAQPSPRQLAAQADRKLLADLEALMANPVNLSPERRQLGDEMLKAVRWWIDSGRAGEPLQKRSGQSACSAILELYKSEHA